MTWRSGSGWKGASWVAAAGNGLAQAAFKYTALASTRLVSAWSMPGLSRSLIFPAVCSATNWLISCLAWSAARRKSASRGVAAAEAASAAVKPGSSGRPDCTHMVLGARSVRSPAASSRRIADTACRPGPASAGLARCSAAATWSAVSPRAPSRTMRSAVAMLSGENTRLPLEGSRP